MVRVKQNAFTNFIKDHGDLFTFVKAGDLVAGRVIAKNPRTIIVDLGTYGTGVIYRGELMHARDVARKAEVGTDIQAKVVEVDNEDGFVELSLAAAARQQSWLKLEELFGKEEVFAVAPSAANKGGLVADVEGVKAFLPASQLSPEHYPRVEDSDKGKIEAKLAELIGKELKVKIIDCNPRTEKLIISERAAAEANTAELVKAYSAGQVIEGIVSGIADFGVFVKFTDNPEVEGLIHVSELAYRTVTNPKEIVNLNDAVRAQIIDIKDGKVSLSLKVLAENPWKDAASAYAVGSEVQGEVYALTPFGAIINIGGLQGQAHVTDFGGVDEMKKRLEKGKRYTFVVKDIKPDEERITLTLKASD
ncbi:hypothetical protein A2110_02655 [Candidatus Jorgensenbacteria bacterium GWA1_54_12]|uniref:S1 motif domain-containing protein n=1 Tax=Candidatus Jorgensenbacteria bacterium GWA1_54_12 TaxID=1798468 RepID=A0A1F6BKM4_9BACT|nr:MAG: hypothetical protein A2110_02655 [Candidatus Jorgensenbacteria bacterium GWA1_54_12]